MVRAPLLEMRAIEKRYRGVHALRGADLTIARGGSVAGLLGENGSGKSTLLGVLSGQVRPDGGTVLLDGAPVRFPGPMAAVRAGIAMVTQETAVAPDLSVTENILLGRLPRRRSGAIHWAAARRHAREVLGRLGLDYDADAPARTLRPDQRQMVEIARAISMDSRILVLDEPTSSLTDEEAQSVFAVARQLKSQDVATILVSHRLAEMFSLADELTILRDGVTASSGPIAGYDADRIVRDMTGLSASRGRRRRAGVAVASRATVPTLSVAGLMAPPALRGVDLQVHAGEIVGIAGLVGAGRSELLEVLFGLRPKSAGTLRLDGEELEALSPRGAIQAGVGYVSPDRKSEGLVLSMSVEDNLTMVASLGASRWRPPRRPAAAAAVARAQSELRLRASSGGAAAGTLSGGNQQKVSLGKWLQTHPRLLLLDEPTRGVDVGARTEIHQLLRDVARGGAALLVSSSEFDELIELCDRIAVMSRGSIVSELDAADATESRLAHLAAGN